jgi:hypothetical protein
VYNSTRGDQVERVVLFQIDGVRSIVRTPLYTNLPCTDLSVHAVVGPVIIRIAMYGQRPNILRMSLRSGLVREVAFSTPERDRGSDRDRDHDHDVSSLPFELPAPRKRQPTR